MTTATLKCQNCLAPLPFSQKPSPIIRCDFCGVENVLAAKARAAAEKHERQFLRLLRKELEAQFDQEETELLVFNVSSSTGMRLDYDDLSGSNKRMKQLSLLQWCQRRRVIPQLVETAVELRPALALLLAIE